MERTLALNNGRLVNHRSYLLSCVDLNSAGLNLAYRNALLVLSFSASCIKLISWAALVAGRNNFAKMRRDALQEDREPSESVSSSALSRSQASEMGRGHVKLLQKAS